jgi:hypothetical protein
VRGLAQNPALALAASAADPADDTAYRRIANDALQSTRPSAAADIGTWLHKLTERMDRGQTLGHVPQPFDADLRAYEKATKGIAWTAIEDFRVHDPFKVAGTADRLGRLNGALVVCDIKTGRIDYPHKISMQIAMYARSVGYDVATDKRRKPDLSLNLNWGIVIHLPAGQGHCSLHRVDILKGWSACQIAHQAWRWRETKGLLEPLDTTNIHPTYVDLALTAPTVHDLRELYHQAKKHCALSSDFLAAGEKRHRQLAAAT